MSPTSQADEEGRCSLHPAIKLKHIQKNGELRVLLNACPLCVSGLPATGEPVSCYTPPPSLLLAPPETEREVQNDIKSRGGKSGASGTKRHSKRSASKKAGSREEANSRTVLEQIQPPRPPPPQHQPSHHQQTPPQSAPHQQHIQQYEQHPQQIQPPRSPPPQHQPSHHQQTPPQSTPHQQYIQQHQQYEQHPPPPQQYTTAQQQPSMQQLSSLKQVGLRSQDPPSYWQPIMEHRPIQKTQPQRQNRQLLDSEDEIERARPTQIRQQPRPPPRFTSSQQHHHQQYSQESIEKDDDISLISMGSVVRKMYKEYGHDSNDGSDTKQENKKKEVRSNNAEEEINTCEFDSKGRCVRHPTVRLRQKKLLQGWKVVLSNCPECCLDEMKRVKADRAVKHKSGKSKKKGSKKKKDKSNLPITQVNVGGNHSVGGEDDNNSIGTASTITISSYAHSTGGNDLEHWQKFAPNRPPQQQGDPNSNDANARVTRMPFTDQYGESGWYTGMVDATSGTPHRRGTMNYSNGAVYQGEWINGVSATPSKTREEPMPCSVSSTSNRLRGHRLKQPQNQHHHHSHAAPIGRTSLTTHYEDAPSIPVMTQPPPRKVVCGMPWSDKNGSGCWYTGEVNSLNIPDGMGSMRYDSGIVSEGLWRDGCQDNLESGQQLATLGGISEQSGHVGGSSASGQ